MNWFASCWQVFRSRNRRCGVRAPAYSLQLEVLEARCLLATCITEFALPEADSRPTGIVAGPDGNLWFTEANQTTGNRIGRITPTGEITRFALPNAASQPTRITVGPDGNLWFTEFAGNRIGRITLDGTITEFPIPTPASEPNGIVTGPDGNVWFTENAGNRIGKITLQGAITEFPVPTVGSRPGSIVAGPDGNLWFTEVTGNRLGRITFQGAITEFVLPTAESSPSSLTVGPDGNLWYTGFLSNRIGRVTMSGTFTEFVIPQAGSRPNGIVSAPDGRLWFTQAGGTVNGVAALQVDGRFDRQVALPTAQASPAQITVGPEDNLWFTELTGSRLGVVHLDPSLRLIRRLYDRLLDRPAALAEQEYWLDVLLKQGARAVTEGIEQAPASRARQVQGWFRTYLGRSAQTADEAYFVGALQAGLTEEETLGLFFGSSEHFHTAPRILGASDGVPAPELLLRSLYRQLLQREPQAGELAFWGQLLTTKGQTAMATDLLRTVEYRQRVVRDHYRDVLERSQEASPAEVQSWVGSALDLLAIRTRFEASQEFYQLGLAPVKQCYVEALYTNALGREASAAEENYWTGVLLAHGSLGVAQGIEQSPEARTRLVQEWYATYLDRLPDPAGEQFFVTTLLGGATEEQTLAILLASPEYLNRTPQLTGSTAATDEAFVQALYQQLLGRSSSGDDLSFWVGQLGSRGRSGLAQALLESPEFRSRIVEDQYEELLRRPEIPMEPEVRGWVLASFDLLALREQFQATSEFYAKN